MVVVVALPPVIPIVIEMKPGRRAVLMDVFLLAAVIRREVPCIVGGFVCRAVRYALLTIPVCVRWKFCDAVIRTCRTPQAPASSTMREVLIEMRTFAGRFFSVRAFLTASVSLCIQKNSLYLLFAVRRVYPAALIRKRPCMITVFRHIVPQQQI